MESSDSQSGIQSIDKFVSQTTFTVLSHLKEFASHGK